MSYKLQLTLNNLNFTVKLYTDEMRKVLESVTCRLVTYSITYNRLAKRVIRSIDRTYYVYDNKEEVYRFPIKIIKNFMLTLGSYGILKEDIELINNTNIDFFSVVYKWNNQFVPREDQQLYIDAIMKNLNNKLFLIDAATGFGKSMLACYLFRQLGYRVGMIILPKYIEKWIDDCQKYLKIPKEEIYVVQGSESLINLMNNQEDEYNIVIFSITTLTYYLNDYETKPDYEFMYPIKPQHLFTHLQLGILFNDETHQCFGAISKCMMYFTAKYFIGSSATLDSNQKDLRKMYLTILPHENRVSNLAKVKAYTYTKAIMYNLDLHKAFRYKRAKGYNHILFEQSILRNKTLTLDYFEMVHYYIQEAFFNKRKDIENDKIAIFFASIDMCTRFAIYMTEKYPNEKVYRYVGGDSYSIMLQSNIIISNNGMLGTAVDIPMLIAVIQTISTASLQINIQNFGRLRNLKDREVWYYYLFTKDISRQYQMHIERYNAIKEKIKEFFIEYYPKRLRTF